MSKIVHLRRLINRTYKAVLAEVNKAPADTRKLTKLVTQYTKTTQRINMTFEKLLAKKASSAEIDAAIDKMILLVESTKTT